MGRFGTDGIRGEVGVYPMDELGARQLGWATATYLNGAHGSTVLRIGEDPRESSERFADAVSEGIQEAGLDVERIGVITTPGLAYLATEGGVMVTASHNPPKDNGLKPFGLNGQKLSAVAEERVDYLMDAYRPGYKPGTLGFGEETDASNRVREYQDFLRCMAGPDAEQLFSGMHFVLDTANGAASNIAPGLFREWGATLTVLNNHPDGRNINQNCGAASKTGLQRLAKQVLSDKADLGAAFDGDADRVLLATDKEHLFDGDHTLFTLAHDRSARHKAVVATVMSNLGLRHGLAKIEVDFHQVDVGDRQVSEKLAAEGLRLGGEKSGHILTDGLPTGDGILTLLKLARFVRNSGLSLDHWYQRFEAHRVPQDLINLEGIPNKERANHPDVQAKAKEIEERFGASVNTRPSGTEELIRISFQGKELDRVREAIDAELIPLLWAA